MCSQDMLWSLHGIGLLLLILEAPGLAANSSWFSCLSGKPQTLYQKSFCNQGIDLLGHTCGRGGGRFINKRACDAYQVTPSLSCSSYH